jgi:hypothetical protein
VIVELHICPAFRATSRFDGSHRRMLRVGVAGNAGQSG